ncbi:retrovirus-related pol polyprotein from transposon TNT 1-94 [Tanacetum coccineum]
MSMAISRNIKRALRAKLKLGFIDGACVKPAVTDVNYQSLHKNYEKRLLKDMVKLKRCWNELQNLNGFPTCTCRKMKECSCGILDKVLEMDSIDPLPNVNKAYYIVQQIEKQKQVTHPSFEPTAFFANLNGNKATNNGREEFKSGGPNRTEFKKKGTRMAAQVTLDEHMAWDTPFDMGYKNGIGMGQNEMFVQKLVVVVCIFSCFTSAFALLCHPGMDVILDWISDTGASGHILIRDEGLDAHFYLNDFAFQDPLTNQIVVVGKGSKCLYICKPMLDPTSFFHNVSSFCQSHVNSTFPISLNKLAYSNSVSSKQHVDIHTFHSRLGHTSASKLIHISDCKHLNAMDFTCESCSLGKHHKLSFPKSATISSYAFELVHIDLWGPYKKPTLNGAQYFFTIMDDYTRDTWTYLHETCSSSTEDFPSFHTFEEVGTAPQTTQDSEAADKQVITESVMPSIITEPVTIATTPSNSIPTRKSSRSLNKPAWLKDFAELNALEKNNIWELTSLLAGHKSISLKWVYKIKYKANGTTDKYKGSYREGSDSLATAKGWPLHQLDINNAFLHSFIDEDIYMQPPAGYNGASTRQSINDYSLFVKKHQDEFTTVLVYVDDILITGLEICRTARGTHLNQRKYILDLLNDDGRTAAKPVTSPMPTNLKLSLGRGSSLSNPESYRRLVGRLLYLTMTRPHISYVVQHLSQFVYAPTDLHMQAGLHLLKYLKGSVGKGLLYPVQPHLHITGFSDADWAAYLMTRRSLTSYSIFLGHSLVSWKTKKQPTVSRFSTEAEYRAMAVTTCKRWMISYNGEKFTQMKSCLTLPYETFVQRYRIRENLLRKVDEEEGAYHEAMKEMLKELKRQMERPMHIV